MWVLTTFFAMATLALAWLCAGYFVVLRFVSFVKKRAAASAPAELPGLSVVIPCYNEADLIVDKLNNLLACDYPAEKLEIVFVDGGSSDSTVQRLSAAIPLGRGVRISHSPRKGKTNQLNHVLPTLSGQIVVITDADGRLRPDALKRIAAEFASDPNVWVVGAYSHAPTAIWRDRCFWDSQNRGRLIESDAFSSSIVIATCYAFRQEMLSEFPEDVVADDVYIGFLGNTLGHRVVYSREAIVEELRGPGHISEFFGHKFRKNNAFLRESLRFLYRLPEMTGFCKLMVLTRIGQQLLLPWAMALWGLIALTLLTLGRLDLPIVAAACLAITIVITSQAFQSVGVPKGTSARFGIIKLSLVFFETLFVLFAAALSYPFFRQTSSFSRLGSPPPAPQAPSPAAAEVAGCA
ncbi:MAG TPA: glycosyltransferase [Phycisphaerae bacterium]|nr:glycosyltransferase [Phycisphaerae bacterium]